MLCPLMLLLLHRGEGGGDAAVDSGQEAAYNEGWDGLWQQYDIGRHLLEVRVGTREGALLAVVLALRRGVVKRVICGARRAVVVG